jgi:hypothetical protein
MGFCQAGLKNRRTKLTGFHISFTLAQYQVAL